MTIISIKNLVSRCVVASEGLWEGNLNKRDIRNHYTSMLMSCDDMDDAIDLVEDLEKAQRPAPVKVTTTPPNRKRITSNDKYRSMSHYNTLEEWQAAQIKQKKNQIRLNGRRSYARPRNTSIERYNRY